MAASRPLLLLTRPRASSEAFWEALPQKARDAVELLINPLLSIRVTGPLPELESVAGLIFTSANALDAYRALGGLPLPIPAIAVGTGTAKAVHAFGFNVHVAGGSAEHVVEYVLEHGFRGPLLHLRGAVAIGKIAQRLTAAGVETLEAVLYEQDLEMFSSHTQEALSQDRPIIAPVFSPRTAQQLGRESAEMHKIQFAALSQAVAEALPEGARQQTRVSRRPDRDAMAELVAEMIADAVSLERRL
ncbi:MAG: uroporphyrinogen-III synthase [Rhodobacteraceae bacterium]|jgi:uroporphyrinogen-III synthase|nr:uroporphyrinogen-III synthase [Paracoccaceae bacterium]PWL30352.1 MAG: uroporphyrinogen-III synthase [Marivita sp. XM-24bin2]